MANSVQTRAGVASGPQQLPADRFASANRRRLSAPAFRTFLSIADLWGLTEEERRLVLGYPSRSTFQGWAKRAREHEDFTLDVGDAISFDSSLPHSYRRGAEGACRAIIVTVA